MNVSTLANEPRSGGEADIACKGVPAGVDMYQPSSPTLPLAVDRRHQACAQLEAYGVPLVLC